MQTIPKFSRKLWKYFVLFGIFLAVAGLVSGVLSPQQSPIAIALTVAGIAIAIVSAIAWGSGPKGFFTQRSVQDGTNATVATLSVLAILGLINFIAVRYAVRVDLTEAQLFTLSPQSQEIVATLPKPLKVFVFDPEPDPLDRELLENYRRQGANFQFEFVDPQINLGLAQRFGVKSPKAAYVEYGDRKQEVQVFRDERELLVENRLTNSIEQILRNRRPSVYFLQGHGEWPLEEGGEEGSISQAIAALRDKGYEVQPLNLAEQPEIPQNADAIAIFGPKRSLFDGEVIALQDYLNGGGSLLIAIDPRTDVDLDPIFDQWGVQLDQRLVIDDSGSGSLLNLGPATPLVVQYGVHPIAADFGNSISVYPLARPVEIESIEGIQAFPLLETNPQSWAEADLESETIEFDPQTDLEGPLTLGVALSKRETTGELTEEEESVSQDSESDDNEEESSSQQEDGDSDEEESSSQQEDGDNDEEESPSQQEDGDSDEADESISQDSESDDDEEESPSQQEDGDNDEGERSSSDDTEATSTPDAEEDDTDTTSSESQEEEEEETPATSQSEEEQSEDESDAPAETPQSRLVVFGNSTFASNGWFDQQINSDVFLNSVQWLAKTDESSLSIRPKQPKNRRLNLTIGQASAIGWLAVFIVPLLGFAIAALMWWRRR
ncbi:MAG: Gldg family protein [Cyanobacteriota bacterium]|nr:Gldg family protein [Cyanobacteriota bacterium]